MTGKYQRIKGDCACKVIYVHLSSDESDIESSEEEPLTKISKSSKKRNLDEEDTPLMKLAKRIQEKRQS